MNNFSGNVQHRRYAIRVTGAQKMGDTAIRFEKIYSMQQKTLSYNGSDSNTISLTMYIVNFVNSVVW